MVFDINVTSACDLYIFVLKTKPRNGLRRTWSTQPETPSSLGAGRESSSMPRGSHYKH